MDPKSQDGSNPSVSPQPKVIIKKPERPRFRLPRKSD